LNPLQQADRAGLRSSHPATPAVLHNPNRGPEGHTSLVARALEAMATLVITLQAKYQGSWQAAWKLVGPTPAEPTASSN
jgi:hypothetical protein